jgi:hypothetical protein
MHPKVGLVEETKGGGKEGKKDSQQWWTTSHCVGISHNRTHCKHSGWGETVRK